MPGLCILDPDLKNSMAETDHLGLPRPRSGNFASVYHMICYNQTLALRFFLQNISGQEHRYAELSKFIMNDSLEETVTFHYIKEGILIKGEKYPVLKMDWVNGVPLDQFIDAIHTDRQAMFWLLEQFVSMVLRLKHYGVAHGDLQHGNILVTESGLRLVDYDGMYVPGLEGLESDELGHRNFQHPKRSREHFGPFLDNFSAWVIYASIEALIVDPSLWKTLNCGDECLLFRRSDFEEPSNSQAVTTLRTHSSLLLRETAKQILQNCQLPLEEVPYLSVSKETLRALGQLAKVVKGDSASTSKRMQRIKSLIDEQLGNSRSRNSPPDAKSSSHDSPMPSQTIGAQQMTSQAVSRAIYIVTVGSLLFFGLLGLLAFGLVTIPHFHKYISGPKIDKPTAQTTEARIPAVSSTQSDIGRIYAELQRPDDFPPGWTSNTDTTKWMITRGQTSLDAGERISALRSFAEAYKQRATIPQPEREAFARQCLTKMAKCVPGTDLGYRCLAMVQYLHNPEVKESINDSGKNSTVNFEYLIQNALSSSETRLERTERLMVLIQCAAQNPKALSVISKVALSQVGDSSNSTSQESYRLLGTLERAARMHPNSPAAQKILSQIEEIRAERQQKILNRR